MADGNLDKQFEDSKKELGKLAKEISEKSAPTTKAQLKQLQRLKQAYAQQAKVVKEFTKQIKALRKEKTHLTKVAERLTSKFGGSAASITRFTSGLKDAVFAVDKGSQKMKILGSQTGITSGKFAGYAAGVQLAVAATIAFLDWMDKLEKKQGTLQRELGKTALSIGAAPRIAAKGWGIAGKAGEEAAKELTNVIAQSRKGLWEDLAGEKGEKAGMDKLITMTAGMSRMAPQWARTLSETFAETSGQGMVDAIMKIGVVANAANVPVDQFGNMVFDLAKEFVHLGIDVGDATAAIGVFIDEMGEGAIKPAVGLAVMRNIIQQQTTAAGLQGRFMTAAFASQNFDALDVNTQNLLNERAREITKDSSATWASLGIGQQATTLKSLDPGQYAQVMQGLYEFLKTMPEIISTAIAPQIIGQEMATAREFWGKLEPGVDIGEEYAKKVMEPTDKFKSAVDVFEETIKENARLQQEFYSDLMKTLGLAKAGFSETFAKARKEGVGIEAAAVRGYGAAVIGAEQRQERRREELERLWVKGELTSEQERERTLLTVGKTKRERLQTIADWFTAKPEAAGRIVAPKGASLVPAEEGGEGVIVETPEGTWRIIWEGATGKPAGDIVGGTPLR